MAFELDHNYSLPSTLAGVTERLRVVSRPVASTERVRIMSKSILPSERVRVISKPIVSSEMIRVISKPVSLTGRKSVISKPALSTGKVGVIPKPVLSTERAQVISKPVPVVSTDNVHVVSNPLILRKRLPLESSPLASLLRQPITSNPVIAPIKVHLASKSIAPPQTVLATRAIPPKRLPLTSNPEVLPERLPMITHPVISSEDMSVASNPILPPGTTPVTINPVDLLDRLPVSSNRVTRERRTVISSSDGAKSTAQVNPSIAKKNSSSSIRLPVRRYYDWSVCMICHQTVLGLMEHVSMSPKCKACYDMKKLAHEDMIKNYYYRFRNESAQKMVNGGRKKRVSHLARSSTTTIAKKKLIEESDPGVSAVVQLYANQGQLEEALITVLEKDSNKTQCLEEGDAEIAKILGVDSNERRLGEENVSGVSGHPEIDSNEMQVQDRIDSESASTFQVNVNKSRSSELGMISKAVAEKRLVEENSLLESSSEQIFKEENLEDNNLNLLLRIEKNFSESEDDESFEIKEEEDDVNSNAELGDNPRRDTRKFKTSWKHKVNVEKVLRESRRAVLVTSSVKSITHQNDNESFKTRDEDDVNRNEELDDDLSERTQENLRLARSTEVYVEKVLRENRGVELVASPLSEKYDLSECLGCGAIVKRLLVHLNNQRYFTCRLLYNMAKLKAEVTEANETNFRERGVRAVPKKNWYRCKKQNRKKLRDLSTLYDVLLDCDGCGQKCFEGLLRHLQESEKNCDKHYDMPKLISLVKRIHNLKEKRKRRRRKTVGKKRKKKM